MFNLQSLEDLKGDMQACQQTPTQNILEHGEAVYAKSLQVRSGLAYHNLRIPLWFTKHYSAIVRHCYGHFEDFRTYCIYHDCGKPYCLTVDADGKRHFPNHELVSHRVWSDISGDPDGYVAQCILHDMDLHRLSANPAHIAAFAALPYAPGLLVSGLAEVYANAELFGGTESSTFKRKYAHIDRRGKAVCSVLFGKKE